MSQQVKGQFNKPKDYRGNFVAALSPGMYQFEQLRQHPRKQGWKGDLFPDADNPNSFPYWDTYLTGRNGPDVLVSVFGEVAVCFDPAAEYSRYRVLEQQWNKQYFPSDSDAEARGRQKYLYVYFNNSPYYNVTHTGLMLHSMVGIVHSPVTLEAVYWCPTEDRYKLKPKINLDHLDRDKANNSVFNLNWVTGDQNTRMTGVDWPEEQKRQFFRDAEKIPREDRDKILIKQ